MAGEKLLSDLTCKTAKPKPKVYYLNDGGGLRLRCRPDGGRTWIFRFRFNGKEGSIGLGSYPQVSLGSARVKAEPHQKVSSEGGNPSITKQFLKATSAAQSAQTFGVIAAEWLAHNKTDWSAHHLERNQGLLNRYLLPDLARLPIDSIEESYLFAVIKPVYDKGTKESARRARGIAAQIFSYAKATHRCKQNPARDMADNPYFKKPPVKHFKALPQDEALGLVAELHKTGVEQRLEPRTVCALLMALYTGLRDHSIRGATWSEIDFAKSTWAVPSSRMKSRRQHIVPLPTQAVTALKALHQHTYRGPESFVFSSNTKAGYMAENTLRQALHRLGHKVTVHGMRSLMTDVLNENGFNADAIEKQLDHQEKDGVRRAYLRSDFMKERGVMMQWFAEWCEKSEAAVFSNNVVSLQGRR